MNTRYLTGLTLIATLGGFLFGFDTAVVNGAEKSLVDLFITKALLPDNYLYAVQLITQYRILVASVFIGVFAVIAGQLIHLLGKRNGLTGSIILLVPLLLFLVSYLSAALPEENDLSSIRDLTDSIKGFVVSSAIVGCIIGAALSGFIAKSIGRKKGLILTAILLSVSAFGAWQPEKLNFFGTLDVFSFMIYRILGGAGIGLASILSPMYIAEIAPAGIRGRLVSWNQFAIISGMVIIYFINYLIARAGNEQWLVSDGWRWMFFSGVAPSLLFLVLLFFIPETPRYLMIKNRKAEAMELIVKISGPEKAHEIRQEIENSLMEKHAPWLAYGYRVIVLGLVLSVFQQFVGINVVMYYAANIFRNMGLSTDASLLQTIVVGIINMLFTIIAIFSVDRFGRKPLLIAGALIMSLSMFSLGTSFFMKSTGTISLIFMLLYIAGFAMSWGPVAWVILAEIYPNSIRGAVSIPVAGLWISNLIVSWTFPIMNDNVWLTEKFSHGFSYWIYGLMCLLAMIFVWKFIPETKGKSLEEIEKFWKKK